MEIAAERFLGLLLFVIGLSHIAQPAAWARFFELLHGLGRPGALVSGMLSLQVGAVVVALHGTTWTGWAALTTVFGWGQLLKGIIHTSLPDRALRRMEWVRHDARWKFVVAGAVMTPLSLVILAASFR